MTQKGRLSIFLSYAQTDRGYAQRLHDLLSRHPNLRIFTTEMLSAGEDWQSRLKDEIAQCDLFIVILSSNSVDSTWVLQELGAAWAINKPIIPVITHPEILTKIPVKLEEVQPIAIKELENPDVVNQILTRYEVALTSPHLN